MTDLEFARACIEAARRERDPKVAAIALATANEVLDRIEGRGRRVPGSGSSDVASRLRARLSSPAPQRRSPAGMPRSTPSPGGCPIPPPRGAVLRYQHRPGAPYPHLYVTDWPNGR